MGDTAFLLATDNDGGSVGDDDLGCARIDRNGVGVVIGVALYGHGLVIFIEVGHHQDFLAYQIVIILIR